MHGNYKILIIILFLLLSFSLIFSAENIKQITILSNIESDLTDRTKDIVNYLIDITELNLMDKYKNNLIIKNINGEVDSLDLKRIENYIFSQRIDCYFYFTITEEGESVVINIKLKDYLNSNIFEDNFLLTKEDLTNDDKFILKEKEEKWIKLINDSTAKIFELKEKVIRRNEEFSRLNLQHDFPFFNIGITAVSIKMYFDERMIYKSNKLFSFFPLELRATVFPLRFFETGLFFRINFDNMVYKYYDDDKAIYDFFDMGVILEYGIFIGVSFFNDYAHYSIGLQIYNIFYDISYYPKWKKAEDYRSNFLPQVALYQKADFKLFKFLYYSIFFNFKTNPKFTLSDNTFYSYPFSYDFFTLEFSIVGFSIMF